jgi:hypothetical protein
MAALEDHCEGNAVELWLGGEEFGKILLFFEERSLRPQEKDES